MTTRLQDRIDSLELGPFDVKTRKAVRTAAGFVLDMVCGVFEEIVPKPVRPLLPFVDQALELTKVRVLRELDEFLGGDGDPTDESSDTSAGGAAAPELAAPRPPPPALLEEAPQAAPRRRSLTVSESRAADAKSRG